VTPSLLTRERAFIESASQAGFEVAVARRGRATYATGAAGAEALLDGRERPDGAFCVTDLIACGFMDVARHRYGIRIPEELSVIGFDDIDQAGWSSYSLTTFAPPVSRLAEKVVELAMQQGDEPPGNGRRRQPPIDVPLVWRDTVRRA
jgi:DNA-binding LacI/PurR family transcriptional regulator